jgi:hypothetical protein
MNECKLLNIVMGSFEGLDCNQWLPLQCMERCFNIHVVCFGRSEMFLGSCKIVFSVFTSNVLCSF